MLARSPYRTITELVNCTCLLVLHLPLWPHIGKPATYAYAPSLLMPVPRTCARLAAHVAPFFTVSGSDGSGLVTSITIPANGPPMVRFFNNNPATSGSSSGGYGTSGSGGDGRGGGLHGRLLLEGVDAPLEEALARLAACGQLLTLHQADGDGAADGSGGWSWDPSTAPPDPFMGADALLVPGTLHRALASRDALGAVSALTYRIGRQPTPAPALHPSPDVLPASLLADLLRAVAMGPQGAAGAGPGAGAAEGVAVSRARGSAPGLLLLGPPGSGKTTLLRCLTYAVAQHLHRTVLVLDNSWEMGGLPLGASHGAGGAARLGADLGPGTQRVCFHHLVRQQQQQLGAAAATGALVQAVSGALALHAPDVVVIDDLQAEHEAGVAAELASRGVVVLAAAPVRDLPALLHHPQLSVVAGMLTGGPAPAARSVGGALAPLQARPPSFCSVAELLPPGSLLSKGGSGGGSASVEPLLGGPALRVHADLFAAVAGLGGSGPAAAAQLRFAQGGKLLVHIA